jgi:peroxin-2
LNSTESIHALLGLANFIAFLWNGRYRTMADRLLKMSLVPSRRPVRRDVSYEFMNRQMVWHAFTEFLLFLLPLINPKTIRRRLHRIASSFSPTLFHALLPFSKISDSRSIKTVGSVQQRRGKYWALPDDQCAICAENATLDLSEPTNLFTNVSLESAGLDSSDPGSSIDNPKHLIYSPYQASCGHIYCYHCIAERIICAADQFDNDQRWMCLRCGEKVTEAHRYTVEVSESERGGSDYDFSSDLDLGTDLSGSMGSYSESGLSYH